ncbi:MAG: hypothetical protein CO064_11960 [Anaerolineae bacterium CG_4_9_14_0_8_um_filter_58_9]|nr:MAG: hypothetical protein CO064_11960 [Anaerolineae bacterium CG_4_9_14_0_8_um_filter_58_9]
MAAISPEVAKVEALTPATKTPPATMGSTASSVAALISNDRSHLICGITPSTATGGTSMAMIYMAAVEATIANNIAVRAISPPSIIPRERREPKNEVTTTFSTPLMLMTLTNCSARLLTEPPMAIWAAIQ